MRKSDLRELLIAQVEEFKKAGGEIVRYASPSNPAPLKLGAEPKLPINLREEAWNTFVEQLKAGEYTQDLDFQDRPPPLRRKHWAKGSTPAGFGPRWRGKEDGRGWRNK